MQVQDFFDAFCNGVVGENVRHQSFVASSLKASAYVPVPQETEQIGRRPNSLIHQMRLAVTISLKD